MPSSARVCGKPADSHALIMTSEAEERSVEAFTSANFQATFKLNLSQWPLRSLQELRLKVLLQICTKTMISRKNAGDGCCCIGTLPASSHALRFKLKV